MAEHVVIREIERDVATQPRCAISTALVEEYAAALREGAAFPPVVVFRDPEGRLWLADGWHRLAAYAAAEFAEAPADVREGTRRDAILWAAGANATHGLRRTNEDKRRAVTSLLRDPEWSGWSNRAIAEACRVDDKTVASVRAGLPELTAEFRSGPQANADNSPPEVRTGRDGRPINVAGLQARGQGAAEPPTVAQRPDPEPAPVVADPEPAPSPSSPPPEAAPASEPARPPERGDLGAAIDALEDRDLADLLASRRQRVRAVTRAQRREGDAYYTPDALASAIVARFDASSLWPGAPTIEVDHDVLEPSGGGGAFARPLTTRTGRLVVLDADPEAPVFQQLAGGDEELHPGQDFLSWQTDRRFDWIVGNPEYARAEDHVRKALSLLKPEGRLVFLLRSGFAGSKKRRAGLFADHRLLEVWPVVPRPSFTGDGRTDGTDYAVFVFGAGPAHPLRPSWKGSFLDWNGGEEPDDE